MFQFNQPDIARKQCSICKWTTKKRKPLEKRFVQKVKTKSVFTIQPIEILVSTTVKSSLPAVPRLTFHSRNKSQHWLYLVGMVHVALQKERVASTINHFLYWRISSGNHDLPQPNLSRKIQNLSIKGLNMLSSHWLRKRTRLSNLDPFHTFSTYIQTAWSSQFRREESSGLLILVQSLLLWLSKISSEKWK